MSRFFDFDEYALSAQVWEKKGTGSKFSEILSHLAFKAHSLRVSIELASCLLIYHLLHSFFVPTNVTPDNPIQVYLWLFSCIVIACIDQFGFSAPRRLLSQCKLAAQQGEYLQALKTLEKIGPRSSQVIQVPRIIYHSIRSRLFAFAKRYSLAEAESIYAENYGISLVDAVCLRTEALRIMGDYERAFLEINNAREIIGEHPCLSIEEGLCLLCNRQDMKKAKKAFEKARELPESIHLTGVSSAIIAHAFLQTSKLWTGHAEEGLERLNSAIDDMRMQTMFQEGARSLLSLLLLERSYYLATHKEAKKATEDLKTATGLCKYPTHLQKSNLIKEELKWRYDIEVS